MRLKRGVYRSVQDLKDVVRRYDINERRPISGTKANKVKISIAQTPIFRRAAIVAGRQFPIPAPRTSPGYRAAGRRIMEW